MSHSDKPRLTRREFLRGALLAFGAGGLAACNANIRETANPWQTPTPYRLLQSPMPAETATSEADTGELEQFIAVSSALTGFDNLNPELGQVYLTALDTHADIDMSFTAFLEEAGIDAGAPTLDAIEQAGVFEDEALRAVADTILSYWYTGIHATDSGEAIATYVDTLAWKSVSNIKPRTICGAPGFWAQAPATAT